MKNPDLNIRVGVISKLSDVLTIPVRDLVAQPSDELPYVLLSTQTAVDDPLKQQFGVSGTLLIQILGKKSLVVNRGEVDGYADDILQAIIPQDTSEYVSIDGFQVIRTSLDNMTDMIIDDSDGITVQKLLRIRFLLREN